MRIEHDSLGEIAVPDDALYGASTRRAELNFPVSGHRMPATFVRTLGLLKACCARVHGRAGRLPPDLAEWIARAAEEVAAGHLDRHFPVDVFQTGSGTSTNMNANEVVARRARQLAVASGAAEPPVHPNDHVNLAQSSNDVIPTVLHLSVALSLRDEMRPALVALHAALQAKAEAFADVVKIGRTHLMDATPLTLGLVFSGYAAQVEAGLGRTDRAIAALRELALGGTAVGNGLNCPPDFAPQVIALLRETTGLDVVEAANHHEAQAARDAAVEVAGLLAAVAASLGKIAGDIRLLASGPRCGLGELRLPAVQPGSSIMPGKVNPVLCEMLLQVVHYSQGLLQVVVHAGRDGQFELNANLPLIAHSLHESIRLLANGTRLFAEKCVAGIEADAARCRDTVERSLMLVTALVPRLGYDRAAKVASLAHHSGRTLREVLLEENLLAPEEIDAALAPEKLARPLG